MNMKARLGELGEKEVVRRLISDIESSAPIGPGDDAAAIAIDENYLVISTDLISARTHIPEGMTDRQIGWMLAASNYSDIAAMGAKPLGIVVSMALPRTMEFDSLRKILAGLQNCSRYVGAEVLGGDTKESEEMTLSGTAIGTVGKERILRRSGAEPGDILAVTGTLGMAAAGYYSVVKGLRCQRCVKALMEPKPRVREGLVLSASGAVTSCMDISDGLGASVHVLSQMSGVSFAIDWESLPVRNEVLKVAEDCAMDPRELVLYYGGDYELLFTLKPEGASRLQARLGSKMSVIGKAKRKGRNTMKWKGRTVEIEDRGFEHFR